MPHWKEKGKDWKWRTKMRTRTTRNWNRNDFYRIIKHSVANMLHRWMQNRHQRCSRKHGLCLKGTPATYIFAEETYGWAYNGNQKKHPRKQQASQSLSRISTSGAASGGQRGRQSALCLRPGRALQRKRAGRLRHGLQRPGKTETSHQLPTKLSPAHKRHSNIKSTGTRGKSPPENQQNTTNLTDELGASLYNSCYSSILQQRHQTRVLHLPSCKEILCTQNAGVSLFVQLAIMEHSY